MCHWILLLGEESPIPSARRRESLNTERIHRGPTGGGFIPATEAEPGKYELI